MSQEHIMLDLETLSSKKDAAIVSIGAIRFDLEEPFDLGNSFHIAIDVEQSQKLGLRVDASTAKWWMKQSEAARKIFDAPAESLPVALIRFGDFVNEVRDSFVWGNGSTFDNVILRNAYEACDIPCPWAYKRDLCFRTVRWLFNPKKIEVGVEHDALDDAKSQALSFMAAIKALKIPKGL